MNYKSNAVRKSNTQPTPKAKARNQICFFFSPVPDDVICSEKFNTELSARAQMAYVHMCSLVNKEHFRDYTAEDGTKYKFISGQTFGAITGERLAERMHCKGKSTYNWINELIEKGFIAVDGDPSYKKWSNTRRFVVTRFRQNTEIEPFLAKTKTGENSPVSPNDDIHFPMDRVNPIILDEKIKRTSSSSEDAQCEFPEMETVSPSSSQPDKFNETLYQVWNDQRSKRNNVPAPLDSFRFGLRKVERALALWFPQLENDAKERVLKSAFANMPAGDKNGRNINSPCWLIAHESRCYCFVEGLAAEGIDIGQVASDVKKSNDAQVATKKPKPPMIKTEKLTPENSTGFDGMPSAPNRPRNVLDDPQFKALREKLWNK